MAVTQVQQPELTDPNQPFVDPYESQRQALRGFYGGNDTTEPGVQAVLEQIVRAALDAVRGYSADAQQQIGASQQQMQGVYNQTSAAQQAALGNALRDLVAQGAGQGGVQAEGLAGANRLAMVNQTNQDLNARMGQIGAQQAADRQAMITNTGQWAKGKAASEYASLLAALDMQTAAARDEYNLNLLALQQGLTGQSSGGGGGGGGRKRRRGGGGGGGSSGNLTPSMMYEPYAKDVNNPMAGTGGPDDPLAIAQTIWRLTTGGNAGTNQKMPVGAQKVAV